MPSDSAPQSSRSSILDQLSKAKESLDPSSKANASSPTMQKLSGAYDILKSLDQRYVGQYVMALENAKNILKSYLTELDDLDRRMEKANMSGVVRKAMGGKDIDHRRDAVEETVRKLNAHQQATIDRISG